MLFTPFCRQDNPGSAVPSSPPYWSVAQLGFEQVCLPLKFMFFPQPYWLPQEGRDHTRETSLTCQGVCKVPVHSPKAEQFSVLWFLKKLWYFFGISKSYRFWCLSEKNAGHRSWKVLYLLILSSLSS